MPRTLDTVTLDSAARYWAAQFMLPTVMSAGDPNRPILGRGYVLQSFYNSSFKDEFEYLLAAFRRQLGPEPLAEFDKEAKARFEPRADAVFLALLADKLAVGPDGKHLPGKVGRTIIGWRVVGRRLDRRGATRNLYWPIYAGEGDERIAGSTAVDALPEGAEPLPLGALNTNISNVAARAACDAIVDLLDEGSAAGLVKGYSGVQPADPDTAATGTLLFTLTLGDPAFGAAADANPGGRATAAAITADSSADATGTLGYCRGSSSNGGGTPLDDHIDGEAGTSGADFNFNTLAIVAGAAVSMTSWTVTMPEG